MAPEGELRLGLRVRDGRIAHVRIGSTRPDVANLLLRGRSRGEIAAAVPRLFSICAHSQASASELACAAAAGEAVNPDLLARSRSAVSAEVVREFAWRTLLDWPRWMGESPSDDAVAAARASVNFRADMAAASSAGAIALATFGVPADEWLALERLPDLDRWMDAGRTATARYLRQVRVDDAAQHSGREGDNRRTSLLGGEDHAAWMLLELSQAVAEDAAFALHPTWHGAPAETGALARLQSDPLITAVEQRSSSRVPARFLARLRELARLLAGRGSATVGAVTAASGTGIGWVENARGLLIHQVRWEQGRAHGYRIVAPTDWNFHPGGAVASALTGTPASDPDAARRRATRLIHSLDPCVACHVEFDDA